MDKIKEKILVCWMIGEDVISRGRIDLSVVVWDRVYIIEFKIDEEEGEALEQIKRKCY